MGKTRTKIFGIIIIFAVSGAVFSACNKDKSQTSSSAKVAAPGKPGCPGGKDPKILTGECQGAWSFAPGKTPAQSECRFAWGPMVKCPAGSKSLGYEAGCYGTTVKPVADAGAMTPDDCAKRFGKYPLPNKYEFQCCEN